MRRSFFLKNLAMFLIPILIPFSILGALSSMITQRYVKEDINKNNINLLGQIQVNIELILNEMDSLSLNFDTNPEITNAVKRILGNSSATLENYKTTQIITSFIVAPTNIRPYIHSIYVYFNNDKNQFISSTNGLTQFSDFADISWYESYIKHTRSENLWVEPRGIKRYSFEKDTEVITFYKKLYSPGMEKSDGVIILNILPTYIEKLLNDLMMFEGQNILVVDKDNKILFANKATILSDDIDLNIINRSTESFFRYDSPKKSYTVTQLPSGRYGWKYISIVPQSALYSVPIMLSIITIISMAFSLALAVMFTYYLTKRNYRRVNNIISILDSADAGETLPPLPSKVKDEYGYIIQNVLKTFLEQSFLKIQLSERKYKMQALELLALQSQINPHFLFNTLETIHWETVRLTGKQNSVSEAVMNLTAILEYSLEKPTNTVLLEREINNTKCYLEILKYRYEDKFHVKWEYNEELLTRYSVIKLLLQPLVENSIYHGIKVQEGECCIKIRIVLEQDYLKISVIDNGLGMNPERLDEVREKLKYYDEYPNENFKHIGLFNTYKRLRLTYGDKCDIKIRSKYNSGTAVYVYIPIL